VKDKGIRELAKAFVGLYNENDRLRLVLVGTFEEKLDPLDEEIMKLIKITRESFLPAGMTRLNITCI
jgi:hypothetical protein